MENLGNFSEVLSISLRAVVEGVAPGHGLIPTSVEINMVKIPEYIQKPFLYNLIAGMA